MMNRLVSFLLAALIAMATAPPVFAQTRTPIVVTKNPLASAAMTADGNLWTTAQPALNFTTALVSVRKSGTVSGCTLTFYTGQTAATATSAVNDANATFSCATATNKVITNIDNYLQGTVSSWTGTGTITIYVTLTNGAGWSLNATLSSVTQGDGAASPGAVPWYVRGTDGTNLTPAGDAQARAISVIPGNGTNAAKHVLDGVGALGAGVLQTATIGTKSAPVASATMAEVVATTTGGGKTVLLGVFVEKATNTTGSMTVTTGTGTNCASNAAVQLTLGPATGSSPLPIAFYPVNALMPADRAVCLTTDGSGTSARVLTQ
jgi:hypothetical protein